MVLQIAQRMATNVGTHKGDNTNNHDSSIYPTTFNTMRIKVKSIAKDILN